jgi:hypothetical protein
MKYYRPVKFLACCLCLALSIGCNKRDSLTGKMKSEIEKVTSDFDLKDVSFLIAENGKPIHQSYANDDLTTKSSNNQNIIDQFSAPVLLDQMIKDSLIKEDSTINKLLPSVRYNGLKPNDLLFITANMSQAWLQKPDSLNATIKSLIGSVKSEKQNINRFNHVDLGITTTNTTPNLFNALLSVSNYFDNTHIEYNLKDTTIANLFPTWYTQNMVGFFGWNVFKFQKHTILWRFFSNGHKDTFLLKFMDDDVLVAFSYKASKNIPTPFDYNKNDLLQSPVAIVLVKTLLKNYAPKGGYANTVAQISNLLKKSTNMPNHFIYIKELIAHARFYERTGRQNEADRLYKLYAGETNDRMLPCYINEPSVAAVDYVSDNADISVPFNLKSTATVQIFAGGQVMATTDYNYSPYQYDNVQIFINKNADSTQSKREDTQSFEFNYRFNKVSGNRDENAPDSWLTNSKVQFAFSDPADTAYILEVKIPWTELNCDNYKNKKTLAVNIFIGDSDLEENRRKSILSWTVKKGQGWDDPSKFGRIILSSGEHTKTLHLNSLKTGRAPEIDGKVDDVWNKAPISPISIPYQGNPSISDNSGMFKSMYDNNNLYFLFYVTDNCKNKTGVITTDKCWIEDTATGALIWKLNGSITSYAPSCYTDQKVRLKAGSYKLRYTSDKGHSFDGWYGPVPQNDVYGAHLYLSKNQ